MRFQNAWIAFAVIAAAALADDAAVPVEKEPNHRTVFENDYIQAFRVTLEPGKTTLMHVHAHDDGAVRLSDATTASEIPGKPPGAPETARPGYVTARDNDAHPLTHRVLNVGATVFDVVDVQALGRPPGPETEPVAKPAAENARMRIYRYELAPGEASATHTHRRPYLMIAATDVNLLMASPDGRSIQHSVKAGDMHWVDTEVTHSLGNRGEAKAILVEFELK